MSARSGRTDVLRRGLIAAALQVVLLLACGKSDQHPNIDPVLRADLRELRLAIDKFHSEQHRYPASLSELKQMHYLRDIPIDPATGSRNWRVTTEETVSNDDFSGKKTTGNSTVVVDVHSSATGKDATGKPYSEY